MIAQEIAYVLPGYIHQQNKRKYKNNKIEI